MQILSFDEAFDLAESVMRSAPYAGYGFETPKGFLRCVRVGNPADIFDHRSEFQLIKPAPNRAHDLKKSTDELNHDYCNEQAHGWHGQD